jgi:hypothetical protein
MAGDQRPALGNPAGGDVRLLLPEKADHRLVWLVSFSNFRKTLPLGIKIHRYRDGFMHVFVKKC